MAGANIQGQVPYQGTQQTDSSPEQNFYMAVTKHMNHVNNMLRYHGDMFGELKGQVSTVNDQQLSLAAKFSQLERRYAELCSYTRYLEEYCLELDVNSRKAHIILTGVSEDPSESAADTWNSKATHDKSVEILSSICDTVVSNDLEATYRIGKPGKNPRPILIKFKFESVRNEVMRKKKLLKETDETRALFMNEDLPPVINRRRADMRAVDQNAKNWNIPATMMGDRMSVNNIMYEHKDIHSLPPGLNLADAKIQSVKGGIAFQSEHAYLSNFFPCPIKYKDIIYNSSANDAGSVKDILSANTGQKAKRAAFRVPNSPAWDQVKLDKMKPIIEMKFNQNHILRAEILKTGEVNLIEATIDTFWGAGLPLSAKKLRDGHWNGHNHLGKILMNYRYEVRRSIPPPQAQAQGFTGQPNGYSNAPPGVQSMNQLATDPVRSNMPYVAQPGMLHLEVSRPPATATSPGIGNFALPSSQVYTTQYISTGIPNTSSNSQAHRPLHTSHLLPRVQTLILSWHLVREDWITTHI